jgi:hypothetical protein
VTVPRELLEAAVALRAADGALWDRFMIGLRTHSASVTADMARCDPALLLRAQGMAIAIQELSSTLAQAPDTLERYRTVRNG